MRQRKLSEKDQTITKNHMVDDHDKRRPRRLTEGNLTT